MADSRTRRDLLALVAGGCGALAGCLGSDDGETDDDEPDDGESVDWRAEELTDATTGESFSISEFDEPVVLHTYATWCGTCQNQHREIETLDERAGGTFVAVELNVDPDEDTETIRDHAENYGFDWRFAVSSPEMTEALTDEFGSAMAVPSQSPIIVVCPDGEVHVLDDDFVMDAADIETAIESDC